MAEEQDIKQEAVDEEISEPTECRRRQLSEAQNAEEVCS